MSTKTAEKLTFMDYVRSIGPGTIMAAAIIGPGTVTTASVQGANYGYTSLWIIAVACVIAYFFQEPAIRISIGRKETVMVGIRDYVGKGAARFLYIAILAGSIAFQAGNLTGTSMALTYFFPGTSTVMWAISMSAVAFAIAWFDRYTLIENINKILIVMMVLAFVLTATTSGPSIGTLISEGFTFHIPGGNSLLLLALLATTVTPNLVLGYSSFLRRRYPESSRPEADIRLAGFDLKLNMFLTFLITGSIIICAAALIHPLGITISSAADMAVQLTPLLGRFAGIFFSLGLWAAAFSSVLYQISIHGMLMSPAFGLENDPKAIRTKVITIAVCVIPVLIIMFSGSSPVSLIITAQALNGAALPLVVALSWKLCTNKEFMGEYVNKGWQNAIQCITLILTSFFALNAFYGVITRIIGMLSA